CPHGADQQAAMTTTPIAELILQGLTATRHAGEVRGVVVNGGPGRPFVSRSMPPFSLSNADGTPVWS
ncbi:MAG TPA: hypothetical protein VM684_11030, partial [Gaiellales bacterium]|nr:hypothetical protein [Gaiellales bacterium]